MFCRVYNLAGCDDTWALVVGGGPVTITMLCALQTGLSLTPKSYTYVTAFGQKPGLECVVALSGVSRQEVSHSVCPCCVSWDFYIKCSTD